MNILSLFDGISCGRVALERANIKVDKYFASEIKESAIRCSQDNWKDIIQIGDITKVHYSNGELQTEKGNYMVHIDMVIGGSPCQDFSQANIKVNGLYGSKSKLFYHYYRILHEVKPNFYFLENVKMKPEHEAVLNSFMQRKPLKIDSQLVCGARRKRLYWTNILIPELPINKRILLQDVLTDGYTPKEKAFCLLVSDSRPLVIPIKMFHRWYAKSFNNLVFKSKEHYEACKNHYDRFFKGLSAKEIDNKVKNENIDISIYDGVRYLNKKEREALQTLPTNYCKILNNNGTADVCGDSWTVDVIAHFFKFLPLED